jgi:hypothetical protein
MLLLAWHASGTIATWSAAFLTTRWEKPQRAIFSDLAWVPIASARGTGRMGLYFLSPGAGLRSSAIVYDRDGSSFALAEAGDFDWSRTLDGASFLHLSGITPALGCDPQPPPWRRSKRPRTRVSKSLSMATIVPSCGIGGEASLGQF